MNRYFNDISFTPEQFDTLGNLLPSSLLEAFQKMAGDHANLLGVGYDSLAKRGLLWIILQTRYEILRMPKPQEIIRIHTWPLPATRLGFERNYLIYDKKGEVLIKGNSLWSIMDASTRKLAQVGNLYPEMEYCLEKTFEERARRLQDFEKQAPASTVIPHASYIDSNGHVNNTYYPIMALSTVGGLQGPLKGFQIDYLHEVLCGQPLKIFAIQEGNALIAKGESAEGARMFACSFIYK
ncbi:MAG: hypothetical protein IJN80_07505 [Clostridia bacterium]|nr:hypothetical protein [Clostridia bacterium]